MWEWILVVSLFLGGVGILVHRTIKERREQEAIEKEFNKQVDDLHNLIKEATELVKCRALNNPMTNTEESAVGKK